MSVQRDWKVREGLRVGRVLTPLAFSVKIGFVVKRTLAANAGSRRERPKPVVTFSRPC